METIDLSLEESMELVLKTLEENVEKSDEQGETSSQSLTIIRSSSILGCLVPTHYGGLGKDVLFATRIIEKIANVDPSIAIIVYQHMSVISRILEWGSEEQKSKYLPKLASGEWLAASAWSERNAGANKQNLGTIGEYKKNGMWNINGSKTFTTGAGLADLYLVLVQTGDKESDALYGNSGQSFFLIETSNHGVMANSKLNLSGMRGSSTGFIEMSDCLVPSNSLLGELGQAPHIISNIRESGMSLGAVSVGIAERALLLAIKHIENRKLTEKEIMYFKVSELSTLLEAARALVERAVTSDSILRGSLSYKSKIFASEVSEKICRECQQIMGGGGFMRGQTIERLTRDARAVSLMGPVNDLAKEIIGREMLFDV